MRPIASTKLETNGINKTFNPTRASIFEEYVLWSACPETERIQIGIESQKQFAEHFKVAQQTLSDWNKRAQFRERVRYLRDQWAFHRTGTVIAGIYKSAVKGNDKSQKLWMQLFEGFTEKTEVAQTSKVEIGENDIRFIINGLPEPMRTKYNGYITEIIIGANEIKNARTVDDLGWDEPRPEDPVFIETDINAQDVPDQGTNEVACRHTERVCTDMEWTVSENNYQSASRRW